MEEISYRTLCYSCLRPSKACFCTYLKPFETFAEFRILMHPKEAKRNQIGTGRLTNHALKNCKIIIDEDFDQNAEVLSLLNSESFMPMILYPGPAALNVSTTKLDVESFSPRRPLIFIIDGTWAAAKSMMRDSLVLHDLPRISFDSSIESKFHIKQQPAKFCLSTIESTYVLLSALEAQGIESIGEKKETLLLALEEMVNFHLKCAADPNLKHYDRRGGSYKDPSERQPSAKWLQRKICFDEKNYLHQP